MSVYLEDQKLQPKLKDTRVVEEDDPVWVDKTDAEKNAWKLISLYSEKTGKTAVLLDGFSENAIRTDRAVYYNVTNPQTWSLATFIHEILAHGISEVAQKESEEMGVSIERTPHGQLIYNVVDVASEVNPKLYSQLMEQIKTLYTEKEGKRKIAPTQQTKVDELYAKFFETMAGDVEFHRALLENKPGVFQQLWEAIKEFFDKMADFIHEATTGEKLAEAPTTERGNFGGEQIKGMAGIRGVLHPDTMELLFGGELKRVQDMMTDAAKQFLAEQMVKEPVAGIPESIQKATTEQLNAAKAVLGVRLPGLKAATDQVVQNVLDVGKNGLPQFSKINPSVRLSKKVTPPTIEGVIYQGTWDVPLGHPEMHEFHDTISNGNFSITGEPTLEKITAKHKAMVEKLGATPMPKLSKKVEEPTGNLRVGLDLKYDEKTGKIIERTPLKAPTLNASYKEKLPWVLETSKSLNLKAPPENPAPRIIELMHRVLGGFRVDQINSRDVESLNLLAKRGYLPKNWKKWSGVIEKQRVTEEKRVAAERLTRVGLVKPKPVAPVVEKEVVQPVAKPEPKNLGEVMVETIYRRKGAPRWVTLTETKEVGPNKITGIVKEKAFKAEEGEVKTYEVGPGAKYRIVTEKTKTQPVHVATPQDQQVVKEDSAAFINRSLINLRRSKTYARFADDISYRADKIFQQNFFDAQYQDLSWERDYLNNKVADAKVLLPGETVPDEKDRRCSARRCILLIV